MNDSQGITPTERILSYLCEKTFLSLWSYSNTYKKEGFAKQKQGTELCDLLVVFGNHVIIFEDKGATYPTAFTKELNWSRWCRKTILKAAYQTYTAEHWIKTFPNEVFLDNRCTIPLPVSFPSSRNIIFHRVAVATQASEACQAEYGGTGSLIIDNTIIGEEDHLNNPFTIGQIKPQKGFVHVFDEAGLLAVMEERDTITDFVEYLTQKEALLTKPDFSVWAAGEDDLLVYFLSKTSEGGHFFQIEENSTGLVLAEGFWEDWCTSESKKYKTVENQKSSAWDGLIEYFTFQFKRNKLRYTGGSDHNILPRFAEMEEGLRILAQECRLARRILASAFREVIENSTPGMTSARMAQAGEQTETLYVFVTLSKKEFPSAEEYDKTKANFLRAYCLVAKLICFGKFTNIVGILTEAGGIKALKSYNLFWSQGKEWEEDEEEMAFELRPHFFENLNSSEGFVEEYRSRNT